MIAALTFGAACGDATSSTGSSSGDSTGDGKADSLGATSGTPSGISLRLVSGVVSEFADAAKTQYWDIKIFSTGYLPDPAVAVTLGSVQGTISPVASNTTTPTWNAVLLSADRASWLASPLSISVKEANVIGNGPSIITYRPMDSCQVQVTADQLDSGQLTVAPCGTSTAVTSLTFQFEGN